MQENIFPIKHTLLQQSDKEKLNGHKGIVLWMFGLSGSGKTTIARALENELYSKGIHTKLLDGDNLRAGITNNLTFSLEDRVENIRRASEVSKLFMENGCVVICSLVSPTKDIRNQAKKIIGKGFKEVYVNAPFDVCAERDVKGLYKKALAGEIKNFTGLDSPFEGSENPFVELKTDEKDLETCKNELLELVLKEIQL
ncbi:MAG: adenylyl-sulfate kinase [Flavobacteriales bacterium]|nr:adenylyl-sulfate kinase [Flavobacteriales bacterium]MBO72035.1 adenylyl-sulfate kinase [Flavobacteriales bacterium]